MRDSQESATRAAHGQGLMISCWQRPLLAERGHSGTAASRNGRPREFFSELFGHRALAAGIVSKRPISQDLCDMSSFVVTCADRGAVVRDTGDAPRKSCVCGSTKRAFHEALEDTIVARDGYRARAERPPPSE